MGKKNRSETKTDAKPTAPGGNLQATAEQIDARLRTGSPPPPPASPLEATLDAARSLDAPAAVEPAGEDEDLGEFDGTGDAAAPAASSDEDAGPNRVEETHIEDLPDVSEEQKKLEADLMEKQKKAEAEGKVPAVGAKPSELPAPSDSVMVLNNNSGPMMVDLPMRLDSERGSSSGDRLFLLSGVNKVDRAHWERAKREKMIRLHIKEENLVELGSRALSTMSLREAIKLVNLTAARDLLLEWQKLEKRSEVVKAIALGLKRTAPTSPKSEEEEDEAV